MITLQQVCEIVAGQLKGEPAFGIQGIDALEKAGPGDIAFAAKDNIKLDLVNAGALLVKRNSRLDYQNLVYVDDPYLAFATLLEYFFPRRPFCRGIDERAFISPTCSIGQDVAIGAFSYLGDQTVIGNHTEIHSGVKIYPGVKIGSHCLIYSNVVIREDVEIGDYVIIQPGAVIGADGFGYTRLPNGQPVKIPQKGKVIIGNHCEIGANTCIDRSTIEETVLADYVKLDNLVQIGHNVRIGKNSALSGLCGISGSVEIGENVIMGGQVGVADHIKIADGAIFAGKTGVSGHIEHKGIYAGTPHQEIRQWQRSFAIIKNLEKYIDRIKFLEKKIEKMEEK